MLVLDDVVVKSHSEEVLLSLKNGGNIFCSIYRQ